MAENTETKVTGRKYRVLIDAANHIWQRFSFWTHAVDVEFNDGKNLQDKLGKINGIISKIIKTDASDDIAVSTNGLIDWCPYKMGLDEYGNLGYYKDGADTVTPFSSLKLLWTNNNPRLSLTNGQTGVNGITIKNNEATLTLDSAGYDYLIFQSIRDGSSNIKLQSFCIVPKTEFYLDDRNRSFGLHNGSNGIYRRITELTDEKIVFLPCEQWRTSTGEYAPNKYSVCIPYKIYGINLHGMLKLASIN